MPRKVIERFAFGVLADKEEYPEYFTHADRFLILDLKNRKEVIHREERENPYAEICREKFYHPTAFGNRLPDEENELYLNLAEMLKDCKYLAGKKFGYWAKELLERAGPSTMMTEVLPQECLDDFIANRHFAGFRDDDDELEWQGKRVTVNRKNFCLEWQSAFYEFLKEPRYHRDVLEALDPEHSSKWASVMTHLVMDACRGADWSVNANGRLADGLPFKSYRGYLDLDVCAFDEDSEVWQFPIAVFELEALEYADALCYNMWKVFCVQADLRVVFFYRKLREHYHPYFSPRPEEVTKEYLDKLHREVVRGLPADRLRGLYGDTLLVMGKNGKEEEFPKGYFEWRKFDKEALEFMPFGVEPAEPFPPVEKRPHRWRGF